MITKALREVDNIGAYLTAYLTDLEFTPETKHFAHGLEVVTKEVGVEGKKVSKKFIKGARCFLYPPGMNLYRKSKGIKFPETVEMPYSEVKEIVGGWSPDYGTMVTILDDNDRELNRITYQHFNLIRIKAQGVGENDIADGPGGLSSRATNSGELPQDDNILSVQSEKVSELFSPWDGDWGSELVDVTGIFDPFADDGSVIGDPSIVYTGTQILFDMVLPRGISSG